MDTGSPLRIQHTEREGCTESLHQNITIVHINPTTPYDNQAFDDSDQCSREDEDFSDGFEQRVEETDCESFTTELSSIIVDTDVTSSPASVIRRGYQVELESDAWSSNSTLNKFSVDTDTSSPASVIRHGYQAGCESHSQSANSSLNNFFVNSDVTSPASIHGRGYQAGLESDFWSAESSLSKLTLNLTEHARTSPDGASCSDSFKGSQRIHLEEDQEHYHQNDKLKSYKSARFPLSIQGNEKSPVSSSNSLSARNEESCTDGSHYVTIEISGRVANRITEAYNTNKTKSPILQNQGGFVNHAFEEGDETAYGLHFLRPRSVSLPNLLLYPSHMKQRPKSTAQSRLNHQVLRTKYLNVNPQLPNPMFTYQRTDGGFDLVLRPERCDLSSSSSSASSNRRYFRNCRRHLCSNSKSSNSSGNLCVNKGLYSEGGIQSTKNRKHLPNPFNKINHRFHSTLHCPCFLFFCFLCCYPAVYLMQRSDIQFISGEDDLARINGKRATVFYVVGAVTSVAFLSIFLFCMYFFLGDSLIKTKES